MTQQSMQIQSGARIQFFEPVRNIAMLCVVLYHSVIAYSRTTPQFPIHDADPILFSDYVRWIFDVFMMPIFFFVAGFFAVPSLKGKRLGSFILSKVKRLGVPWITVMISLTALLLYGHEFRAAFSQQKIVSFGDFLMAMLKGFIQFNSADKISQIHLWFLSLLLVFFVVFGIIYRVLERRVAIFINKYRSQGSSEKSVFISLLVFGSLISVVYFIMVMLVPKINDFVFWGFLVFEPTKVVSYIGYFLLGAYGYSKNWFSGNMKLGRMSFWILILVLSLSAFLLAGKEILVERAIPEDFPLTLLIVIALARSFLCLSVLVLLLSLAVRYWNSPSGLTLKLSENSYHIYIMHFFIVLALQAALLKWQGGPTWIKLAIVFFTALIISYLISQYVTNRFPKATVAGLLLICFSLVIFLNPHRYERKFDKRQLEFKEKLSQMATDHVKLRNDSILSFKKALEEPKKYTPEAFEKLSLVLHSQPYDYEIMSYLGRVTVMLVTHEFVKNLMDFMVHDAKGFKWMDYAVEKDPDNVNVRLNRALDSLNHLEFLDREKYAKIDFEYLAKSIQKNPDMDGSIKGKVFSNLIIIYEKNGNYKESEFYKKKLLELKQGR